MAQQLSPMQINQIARAAIKARAVKRTQEIFNQTYSAPIPPTITVVPRNVGLIKGFWCKVTLTVDNGSGVNIEVTDFGAANALSQIQFNDLQNNTRIQTSGWHCHFVNSEKARRPFGFQNCVSFEFNNPTGSVLPIDYNAENSAAKMTGQIFADPDINAAASGTVVMWYWIPLSYSDDDLRGAVYANVVNATMQLNLSFPGTNGVKVAADNGTDSTLAIYAGVTAGSTALVAISQATVQVYQVYMDQLPTDPQLGVLLPVIDLATIYELKNTAQSAIVANTEFPYQYANFRDFLSTTMVYVNDGAAGTRAGGTDINYFSLQAANFSNIWKKNPDLVGLETRNYCGVDFPPGVYYFGTREKPISTVQYGNMQLILNANTAAAGAYQLIGVEDFALTQTLSMAGSLAAS